MAVTWLGRVVSATGLTSGNTQAKTLTSAVPAGDVIIAYAGFGESPSEVTTYTMSGISDSKGNTWNFVQLGHTRRGVGIAWTRVTNALTTSDTITWTFTNSPGVCWTVAHRFTGLLTPALASGTNAGFSDTASVNLSVSRDGLATAIAHWPTEFGVTPAINNGYSEIDNFSHVGNVEYYSIIAKNFVGSGSTAPSETIVVSSVWGMAAVALPEFIPSGGQVIFVG
jgi:hypothetical protein